MLTEIVCDKFREKKIPFHPGLNVVLGDEKATNSIGKSALLMVLDFVFGGDTFIKHNQDVIRELGDHEYNFSLLIDGQNYYFRRSTLSPTVVYKCAVGYKNATPMPLQDYTAWLKKAYGLNDLHGSFREIVGLYSRVWGKENLNVHRPLHGFTNQNASDSVDLLLKLFNRYGEIQKVADQLDAASDSREAINLAVKQAIVPMINKHRFIDNTKTLTKIEKEVDGIKKNLALFACNIAKITNKQTLELKQKKDDLLALKRDLESKLQRVQRNAPHKVRLESHGILKLKEFFPTLKTDRIEEIEAFHVGLSKILTKELANAASNLSFQLEEVDLAIKKIDDKLQKAFSSVENPEVIIDRVLELSNIREQAVSENSYFEKKCLYDDRAKTFRAELKEKRTRICEFVSGVLNDKMRELTTRVYSESRKSPKLEVSTGHNYNFAIPEDTGTGTAYSSLIIYDLAVFNSTSLPFLIHDSVLYKNIENDAVSNLVISYESQGRQSFVAIDEIGKYGDETRDYLVEHKVIQLDGSHLLYGKDWKK